MYQTDLADEPDNLLLFTPVQTAYRGTDGWTGEVQRAFVAALARTGTVAAAARSVGRNPRSTSATRSGPSTTWTHDRCSTPQRNC